MDYCNTLNALRLAQSTVQLSALALSDVPTTNASAVDVVALATALPAVPFDVDADLSRRLAEGVIAVVGDCRFRRLDSAAGIIVVRAVAILASGAENGVVAFAPIPDPQYIDFSAYSLSLRVAILAQRTTVGL